MPQLLNVTKQLDVTPNILWLHLKMSIHRSPRVCLLLRYCLACSERQYEPKNRAIAAGGGKINPAPKVFFAKQHHRKSSDAPSRLGLGAKLRWKTRLAMSAGISPAFQTQRDSRPFFEVAPTLTLPFSSVASSALIIMLQSTRDKRDMSVSMATAG